MDIFGQLGINGAFLLAQIINFLILFFLLRRFLLKPVMNMLDARRQRIEDGMKAADRARQAAETERAELMKKLDEERRAAQSRIAAVASDSEKVRESILATAQAEAEEIKTKARADASAERAQMLRDMQRQVADLAVLAAERILGHELTNPIEQKRMVNEFLASKLQ
ncbi:F0F1 ATP synthase subunit B [Candidatus Amarolinea aalborgensis]|uniref:F0F1 ATP synthase subunit B n=1 Tax=Candidatus Amarolinea aalborgensis TaxID=2249329 RepID=UPI003BFA1761